MAIKNFIPTVWSESLLQSLDQNYVAVSNCNREFEGEIKEKGSTVRICGLDNVSVGNYVKNTDISTAQELSDNYTELVINQAKYFNFQIDDVDRAQATPRLMELALKNAAKAIAKETDTYIYNLFSQGAHQLVCSSSNGLDIINSLIDARTKLLECGVTDPSDIVIEVTPAVAGAIMKAKIDISTDNTDVLENGCIGNLFGSKIFVSSNITSEMMGDGLGYHCLVRSKRAIAFAEQLSEIEAYRPELRFADAMKGLHLYGAKVVYPLELASLTITIPM